MTDRSAEGFELVDGRAHQHCALRIGVDHRESGIGERHEVTGIQQQHDQRARPSAQTGDDLIHHRGDPGLAEGVEK